MLLFLVPGSVQQMAIRLSPNDTKSTMHDIEKLWSTVFPEDPIQYVFVDEGAAFELYERRPGAVTDHCFCISVVDHCLARVVRIVCFCTRTPDKRNRHPQGKRRQAGRYFVCAYPAVCRMDTDCLYYCGPGFLVCHASLASAFRIPHGDFMVDFPAGFFHFNTGGRDNHLLEDISCCSQEPCGGVEV